MNDENEHGGMACRTRHECGETDQDGTDKMNHRIDSRDRWCISK